MSSKLLLLIPCLCFCAIFLRWVSDDSSIKPLKAQLADLQQLLQGFEELKEEFVRHRIELSWEEQHLAEIEDQRQDLHTKIVHIAEDIDETSDKRHLTELKDRRAELSTSLAHMSDAFKRDAGILKDNNSEMARALAAMHEHNIEMRENDMKTMQHLQDEAAIVHEKVRHERDENAYLKEILDELRSLLDNEETNTVTRDRAR